MQIVGVNRNTTILESYNAAGEICSGRDLPFLEQPADGTVWSDWGIRYRDVVVVDQDNEVAAVYNLTDNSLAEQVNRDALFDIILEVAGTEGAGGAGGAGGSGGVGGAGGT